MLFHISFKYSWTSWTAIAPSPTAEATRLTEPARTSPAANTPGWLVSNKNGGGLAGGVTAADDHYLRPPAHRCLIEGRGVVDAATLQWFAPLDAQPPVVGPGGDQQTFGRHRLIAVEVQHRIGMVERQAGNRCG